MNTALIYLDPGSPLTLQNQIREQLVGLIVSGVVAPGTRLPSTRGLADQLDAGQRREHAPGAGARQGFVVHDQDAQRGIAHAGRSTMTA